MNKSITQQITESAQLLSEVAGKIHASAEKAEQGVEEVSATVDPSSPSENSPRFSNNALNHLESKMLKAETDARKEADEAAEKKINNVLLSTASKLADHIGGLLERLGEPAEEKAPELVEESLDTPAKEESPKKETAATIQDAVDPNSIESELVTRRKNK